LTTVGSADATAARTVNARVGVARTAERAAVARSPKPLASLRRETTGGRRTRA
jgi:hypothetical protein